jgi:hypothetical protein
LADPKIISKATLETLKGLSSMWKFFVGEKIEGKMGKKEENFKGKILKEKWK